MGYDFATTNNNEDKDNMQATTWKKTTIWVSLGIWAIYQNQITV